MADNKTSTTNTNAGANTGSTANRRRSSASERFGSLKRDNERATAARASFSEQRPAPGFIGKLWNDFTRGSTGSSGSDAGTK